MFRDQEFSGKSAWSGVKFEENMSLTNLYRSKQIPGDMNSKAVNRIENVRGLRARQFNEDAGPMSHPIRPESYIR